MTFTPPKRVNAIQMTISYAPAQMHSATSIAAAEAILPHVGTLEHEVYEWLRVFSTGLTDQELCEGVEIAEGTCRARRIALTERGLVKDSGTTRKTRSGRQATVWVVTK